MGDAGGEALLGAVQKSRVGVFQLPTLNVDLDEVGEGPPCRDLAVVFHPGLDDVVNGGRRKARSVSEEAYELVKGEFGEIGLGQGVLQQL